MSRNPRYDILFEPVKIGPVTAPNRFYCTPHALGTGQQMPHTRAAMRGYDLILAPNHWGPPEKFKEPQAIFHFLDKASLSMPFNVTGQPAMTVCCGFGHRRCRFWGTPKRAPTRCLRIPMATESMTAPRSLREATPTVPSRFPRSVPGRSASSSCACWRSG